MIYKQPAAAAVRNVRAHTGTQYPTLHDSSTCNNFKAKALAFSLRITESIEFDIEYDAVTLRMSLQFTLQKFSNNSHGMPREQPTRQASVKASEH